MADLNVNIAGLSLKNPVMTASGTFGYGLEFADFINLEDIGGIIVKGTTLKPREGNPYPRMYETASGMLNCVGLQNKGVDYFCEHIYPQIKDIHTNMIVNVSGSCPEDYAECAARINELEHIPAIELNISCPNVKQGGMAFGVTPEGASSVVRAVREAYKKTLIVKLSPNVTSVVDIAKSVVDAGLNLGKSAIGIFTGEFENISQIQTAVKNGGIIDGISNLLDYSIKFAKNKGLINASTANLLKQGKNTILNSISSKIEEELTEQLKAAEKLQEYCNKWQENYEKEDFSSMESNFKNIEKYLEKITPFENTIKQARKIENIHNLIKNNGKNFNISENEKILAEKLAI